MLVILCILVATIAFLWLVPGRRASEPFNWSKGKRWGWLRRWRARSAFPNGR